MSHERRKAGKEAEERVAELFCAVGSDVQPGSDYYGKVDLVVDGTLVQVSISPKSAQARKSLSKSGIINIPGGGDYTDEDILDMFF